jgi:signal recognition particle subunit SRP54
MTRKERQNPKLLNASRKKRVAAGSGTKVEEINRLLKMHRQMSDMMKALGGKKGKGMMGALGNMMGLGGGVPGGMPDPSQLDPKALEEMAKAANGSGGLPGGFPPGLPGLPSGGIAGGGMPGLPGGLPPDLARQLSKGKKK